MCGIAGFFHFQNDSPADGAILRAMAESITHRGPDEEGFYQDCDGRLGLAFRRLSILDIAGGKQPMPSGDQRYQVIFNGEIYNYQEVRSDLEARGRTFRTRSDTEAIVEAYAEYGPECVTRFQGMFAFAIWDSRERTLFLARDRVGIKPLYYAVKNGKLVFGSEIKSVFKHPDFNPELNHGELSRYFTFLSIPAPGTLFDGVLKLRAGRTLMIRAGADLPAVDRYWNPITEAPAHQSEDAIAEELRSLLVDSVRSRLMSDVPFGAFLSGGLDSSAIVAIMAQSLDRPVQTFNVGYKDDPQFNETSEARQVAKLFGTDHHEIMIDHEDFKSFIPRLVHFQDEPLADPVAVPVYFVAELARRNGVIVSLIGEGADELFFGYDLYNRVWNMVRRLWNPLAASPRIVRELATRAADPFVDIQRRDFLRRLRSGGEPFIGGAVAFYPDELRRLAPALGGHDRPEAAVDSFYAEIDALKPGADFTTRVGYLELMYRLPELLLMRTDKMTMAASVEGRVPFLDHRLVELAFRIPAGLKVKNGVRKHILKRAVEGILPDEVIYRQKVGFRVPVTRWFEEVLSPLADDALFSPEMRSLGLWDENQVRQLLAQQRAGKGNFGMRIWTLVNFAFWYRHWFAKGSA